MARTCLITKRDAVDLADAICAHLGDAIFFIKTISKIEAYIGDSTMILKASRCALNSNKQSTNTRKAFVDYVTHRVLLDLKGSLDALDHYTKSSGGNSVRNDSQTLNATLFGDDRFHLELLQSLQKAL